jgi:hypothetical protein
MLCVSATVLLGCISTESDVMSCVNAKHCIHSYAVLRDFRMLCLGDVLLCHCNILPLRHAVYA